VPEAGRPLEPVPPLGPGTVPGPGTQATSAAGTERALTLLERRIAAQAAAVAACPPGTPLPPRAVALLATPPSELDGAQLRPQDRPRLVKLMAQVQDMLDDLGARQTEVAARLGALRAVRRGGPVNGSLDCSG
jgi:hypothetical protein